jgi:hypothetical protein
VRFSVRPIFRRPNVKAKKAGKKYHRRESEEEKSPTDQFEVLQIRAAKHDVQDPFTDNNTTGSDGPRWTTIAAADFVRHR